MSRERIRELNEYSTSLVQANIFVFAINGVMLSVFLTTPALLSSFVWLSGPLLAANVISILLINILAISLALYEKGSLIRLHRITNPQQWQLEEIERKMEYETGACIGLTIQSIFVAIANLTLILTLLQLGAPSEVKLGLPQILGTISFSATLALFQLLVSVIFALVPLYRDVFLRGFSEARYSFGFGSIVIFWYLFVTGWTAVSTDVPNPIIKQDPEALLNQPMLALLTGITATIAVILQKFYLLLPIPSVGFIFYILFWLAIQVGYRTGISRLASLIDPHLKTVQRDMRSVEKMAKELCKDPALRDSIRVFMHSNDKIEVEFVVRDAAGACVEKAINKKKPKLCDEVANAKITIKKD